MPGVQTPFSQPQAVSSVPKSQRGRRDARRWLFQDAPSAYGGTGPNVCYTALVLPPTKSFCPYKTIPASTGLRNMTALGGSVSATRFERLRRTLTFYRFLKPSPIARESAFRSNSSRFTDTLGSSYLRVQMWTSPVKTRHLVYPRPISTTLDCSSVIVCKVASSYYRGADSSTFCQLTLA